MKKLLITFLAIIVAASLCIGCAPTTANETTPTATVESTPAPETTEAITNAATTAEQTTEVTVETVVSTEPETVPESGEETEIESQPETSPETAPEATEPEGKESSSIEEETDPSPDTETTLGGVDLSEYVIVYGDGSLDYNTRAAKYISDQIFALTGVRLSVVKDTESAADHEIVVGETNRSISANLKLNTEGVEFSFMAENGHIAMEADYFVIAAAAYYFVETFVEGGEDLPTEATICEPIVEKANNYIFLIGDGMGYYQTRLFDNMNASDVEYSDNEDIFYGYLLPYFGFARTNSLEGVTDSAASGTALASGYKTNNGYVGQNGMGRKVKSLTEIAGSLGKATAVMSTEVQTGATPSSFSAHAGSRNDSATILATQKELVETYGTIIKCDFNYYTAQRMNTIEGYINDTLTALSADEDGFFLMYEEAYIDKHCHNNDIYSTFNAMVRFNQAIAVFMEYAFYNPDTMLIITADHETGKLLPTGSGGFSYGSGDHTAMHVPVFAYGDGAEVFDGKTIENIQIPKTIASYWGYSITGTSSSKYPSLAR